MMGPILLPYYSHKKTQLCGKIMGLGDWGYHHWGPPINSMDHVLSIPVPGRVPRWICTPKCSVGGHHDMELTEADSYRCSAEQVAGSLET